MTTTAAAHPCAATQNDRDADAVIGGSGRPTDVARRRRTLPASGRTGAVAGFGNIGAIVHDVTQKSAVGFAPYNALGLTPSGLYVFAAQVGFSTRVGQQLGYWSWGTFDATTSGGSVTRSPNLLWNDGSASHLEAKVVGVEKFHNDALVKIVGRARRAMRANRGEAPPTYYE